MGQGWGWGGRPGWELGQPWLLGEGLDQGCAGSIPRSGSWPRASSQPPSEAASSGGGAAGGSGGEERSDSGAARVGSGWEKQVPRATGLPLPPPQGLWTAQKVGWAAPWDPAEAVS